jgi:hypothetical protein
VSNDEKSFVVTGYFVCNPLCGVRISVVIFTSDLYRKIVVRELRWKGTKDLLRRQPAEVAHDVDLVLKRSAYSAYDFVNEKSANDYG